MPTRITPDYVKLDYSTFLSKLRDELSKSTSPFKDVNYEGSNISVFLETLAYFTELNTYYLNRLAKNMTLESADQYDTTHRLAKMIGYDVKGYVASSTVLTISISADQSIIDVGDQLVINPWIEISSTELTNDDNQDSIIFTIPNLVQSSTSDEYSLTFTVPASALSGTTIEYDINVPVRQGKIYNIYDYSGSNIINNEIILPFFKFDYDDSIDDQIVTCELIVDGVTWTRVSNFYDNLSPLNTIDTVYKLEYDQYSRYKLVFSTDRTVPESNSVLNIKLLETFGSLGNVSSNTITGNDNIPSTLIYNSSKTSYIPVDNIIVTNEYASGGGSDPETLEEIKENAQYVLNAQYRNATNTDYESHLLARGDVDAAYVYGENLVSPSGSTYEYNKVHITVIPPIWGSSSINVNTSTLTRDIGTSVLSASIYSPSTYSANFRSTLSRYLEPRKMFSAYEIWEIPILVYFYFDIGIRVHKTYDYSVVMNDVRNKLIEYFSHARRSFGEIIDFMDITNFILDEDNVTSTNNFSNIKGIQNLNIREIGCSLTIYDYNLDADYPYYMDAISTWSSKDNQLNLIQLGPNQFPELSINLCQFINETRNF